MCQHFALFDYSYDAAVRLKHGLEAFIHSTHRLAPGGSAPGVLVPGRLDDLRYIGYCLYCPTEYFYTARTARWNAKDLFQVDRYVDFGECLPTDVKEWNAVMSQRPTVEFTKERSPFRLWQITESSLKATSSGIGLAS